MTRALADQGRTIRVPAQVVDTINRMSRIERQLTQKLGRPPATEELAVAMELKPEKIEHLRRVSQEPVSLAAPVGEDSTELGELIEDERLLKPGDDMAELQRDTRVADLVAQLPYRERTILELRYGLGGGAAAHARRGGPAVRRHPRARAPDRDAHAAAAGRGRRARRPAPPDRLTELNRAAGGCR